MRWYSREQGKENNGLTENYNTALSRLGLSLLAKAVYSSSEGVYDTYYIDTKRCRLIKNNKDDIALQLNNIKSVGKTDRPNPDPSIDLRGQYVCFRVRTRDFEDCSWKPVESGQFIGLDDFGKEVIIDLSRETHLLVAGASGSGKSVFIESLIHGARKSGMEIINIGTKGISVDGQKQINKDDEIEKELQGVLLEMESRNKFLESNNLKEISAADEHIVVVIDDAKQILERNGNIRAFMDQLFGLGRNAGIHLILGTQDSTKASLKRIKDNFGIRVAFRTTDFYNSNSILGKSGAEKLRKRGDGIILRDGDTTLFHSCILRDVDPQEDRCGSTELEMWIRRRTDVDPQEDRCGSAGGQMWITKMIDVDYTENNSEAVVEPADEVVALETTVEQVEPSTSDYNAFERASDEQELGQIVKIGACNEKIEWETVEFAPWELREDKKGNVYYLFNGFDEQKRWLESEEGIKYYEVDDNFDDDDETEEEYEERLSR